MKELDWSKLPKIFLDENGEMSPVYCIRCGVGWWATTPSPSFMCGVCSNFERREKTLGDDVDLDK